MSLPGESFGRGQSGHALMRACRLAGLTLWLGVFAGCAGSPQAVEGNRVFFEWATLEQQRRFEAKYPPLTFPANADRPEFEGVSVLEGMVRLSRPRDWHLLAAQADSGSRYILYASPDAYLFGVYERPQPAKREWGPVLDAYEKEVGDKGGRILGGRYPIATALGRGWVYSVERPLSLGGHALTGRSRELLLRSAERLVLIQVVHQETNVQSLDERLLHVVRTLEVL